MKYLWEAFAVALYSGILYNIITELFSAALSIMHEPIDFLVLLFIVGFFKHSLGFFLRIHSAFCNYGDACQRSVQDAEYIATSGYARLFYESFLEGLVFMIAGYLLSMFTKDRLVIVVFVGFSLHLGAEYMGIHKYFCRKRCARMAVKNDSVPLFEPALFQDNKS